MRLSKIESNFLSESFISLFFLGALALMAGYFSFNLFFTAVEFCLYDLFKV